MNEAHIPLVYAAINAVQTEMAATGITKSRKNAQQGYQFRGIDDVYNALSSILARNKLCILPRILTREVAERRTRDDKPLFYVTVEAEFDLVCSTDGSKVTVRTFGEAMDSADKATNKAMSAAYKYMAMQTFAIPTEGDNDADAHTPEVAALGAIDPKRERIIRAVADACIAKFAQGDEWGAYDEAVHIEDPDERNLLWKYLKEHSKLRSTLKQLAEADRAGERVPA